MISGSFANVWLFFGNRQAIRIPNHFRTGSMAQWARYWADFENFGSKFFRSQNIFRPTNFPTNNFSRKCFQKYFLEIRKLKISYGNNKYYRLLHPGKSKALLGVVAHQFSGQTGHLAMYSSGTSISARNEPSYSRSRRENTYVSVTFELFTVTCTSHVWTLLHK